MHFVSRECDYAIRIVRVLANMEIKTVQTICEREKIPKDFAYKILKKIERAGIVNSHRGTHGGYSLAKRPEEITLYDVLSVVSKNVLLNECLQLGIECPNNTGEKVCLVHKEIQRIQEALEALLKEKTMDMLI